MEFSQEDLAASFPQLEILEPLGRGGMGIVYKARQKELGRLVALKLLPPERVADPRFAERFRREAQALASLAHPNIVAIHDFGQTNGLFYLLMEYVDGVNLRQAMTAGRFTPDQALAIVPPVCEALQFAHEHGVVHRDIKPENLLLDKRGHVKIADFGIAKMLGRDALNRDVAESQPAGTPQYMAPEQRQPGHTDHRADIYSLGVVLYELLTGELPTGSLQPPSRRIQVDVHIDEIVLRALEKSPEMRFRTAAEFGSRVEAVTRRQQDRPTSERSDHAFSALALWGAAWAAICLISLPLLDMAWIGGLGSLVIGLGAFTILLIVLLGFLAVRVVWRSLHQSRTSENSAGVPRSWRTAAGMLLALAGGVVLLGAPVVSELADGFLLTKAARDRHQEHEQTGLHKQASEKERSTLLYMLGGGWMAIGLFTCLRGERQSRRLVIESDESPLMVSTATLMTPAELASVWNQFFCYRTRGSLLLDESTLTHRRTGVTTSIPLRAIRDVSIGRLPRFMNPAGLNVLSIRYEVDGETRQVLISPLAGFQFSQEGVSDWCAAIRKAVVSATGRKPSFTPPEQLGIPQSPD